MKKYLLLLLSLLLVVTVTAKKHRGPVRQCHCDELEQCQEEKEEELKSCQAKCAKKLDNDDWDKQKGQKCFKPKEDSKTEKCQKKLKEQT